jgi:hypothetical protein
MMIRRRSCDDGGINIADEFAIIGNCPRLGFLGDAFPSRLNRVDYCHQLDLFQCRRDPRVDLSQMPSPNNGNT